MQQTQSLLLVIHMHKAIIKRMLMLGEYIASNSTGKELSHTIIATLISIRRYID